MRSLFKGRAISSSMRLEDQANLFRSHSQVWCMAQSVNYLESRHIDVSGIVDKIYSSEEFARPWMLLATRSVSKQR